VHTYSESRRAIHLQPRFLTLADSLAPFDVSVLEASVKRLLDWSLMSWMFFVMLGGIHISYWGGGPPAGWSIVPAGLAAGELSIF
jgi:hypothetical protein